MGAKPCIFKTCDPFAIAGDVPSRVRSGVHPAHVYVGVAQHGLNGAQVSAASQKMRREGVTQRVRRDVRRWHTRCDCEVLDHDKEAVPRQVSIRCPSTLRDGNRYLEAGLPFLIAAASASSRDIKCAAIASRAGGESGTIRSFPPLPRTSNIRGYGQGHQFCHAHAGCIQKLHQAGIARCVTARVARGL